MNVEFGDDATNPMRPLASSSFHMPLGDVVELNDVLFVLGLKKSLFSNFCMVELHCRVAFEGHHSIISDCSIASSRTLSRGVLDGGLYKLFVDYVALVL